jgi:tetratricopeptide (TPR) repeat protein
LKGCFEKMNSFNQIPLEAITLYRQALEMSGRGNYELALKNLGTAVMLAPKFALAYCEMGRCYEKLERFPEALSKYDKVLQIYPTHSEAAMNKKHNFGKDGEKEVRFYPLMNFFHFPCDCNKQYLIPIDNCV